MRYRTTIRGEGVELRGYIDAKTQEELVELAEYAKPYGWLLIASPAEDDYDPFKESAGIRADAFRDAANDVRLVLNGGGQGKAPVFYLIDKADRIEKGEE